MGLRKQTHGGPPPEATPGTAYGGAITRRENGFFRLRVRALKRLALQYSNHPLHRAQ